MARKNKAKGKRSRAKQGNNAKHQHKLKPDDGRAVENTTPLSSPERTLGRHNGDPTSSRSRISSASLTTAAGRRKIANSRASSSSSGTGTPADPWDPLRELPTRGLANLGNTCFFNSALQNVFKTRLLHEALFANPERRAGPFLGPINKAFRKSMLEMVGDGAAKPSYGSYSPTALLSAVRRAHPSFKGNYQQDAHELFMRLLGTLEDEEDAYIKRRLEEQREVALEQSKEKQSGEQERTTLLTKGGLDCDAKEKSPTGDDQSLIGRRNTNSARSAPGSSGAGKRTKGNMSRSDVPPPGEEIHSRSLSTSSDSSRGDRTSTDSLISRSGSSCDAASVGCHQTLASTPSIRAQKSSMVDEDGVGNVLSSELDDMGNRSDKEQGRRAVVTKSGLNGTTGATVGRGGRRRAVLTTDDDGETTDEGDLADEHDRIRGDDGKRVESRANMATADPSPHESSPAAEDSTGYRVTSGTMEQANSVVSRAAVTEVFGGSLCSVVTCASCKARSFSTEPTICLSLVIPPRKARSLAARKGGVHVHGVRSSVRELSAKEKRKRARTDRARLKSSEAEAGRDGSGEGEQEKEIAGNPSSRDESASYNGAITVASQDLLTREGVRECLEGIISQIMRSSVVREEAIVVDTGSMAVGETMKVTPDVRIHGANSGRQSDCTFVLADKGPHPVNDGNSGEHVALPCAGDSRASNGSEAEEAEPPLRFMEIGNELQVLRNESPDVRDLTGQMPRYDAGEGGAVVTAEKEACGSVDELAGNAEVQLRAMSLCSTNLDDGRLDASRQGGGGSEEGHKVSGRGSRADAPKSVSSEDVVNSGPNSMLSTDGACVDECSSRSPREEKEHNNGSDNVSFEECSGTIEEIEEGNRTQHKGRDDQDSAGGKADEALETEETPRPVPESPFSNLVEPPPRVVNPNGKGDPAAIDLYGCLDHFMAEEELVAAEGNGYDCEKCRLALANSPKAQTDDGKEEGADKEEDEDEEDVCKRDVKHGDEGSMKSTKRDARKRLLMLGEPPGVLVCHLKRLQAQKKILTRVEFPEKLDMAPYFWRDPQNLLSASATLYRLFGLVEHRGNRFGGHYVAYVKDTDIWKHASDLDVRPAHLTEVMKSNAYMLFYERVDKDPSSGNEANRRASAKASSEYDELSSAHSRVPANGVNGREMTERRASGVIEEMMQKEGEEPVRSFFDMPSCDHTTGERPADVKNLHSSDAEGSEVLPDGGVSLTDSGNGRGREKSKAPSPHCELTAEPSSPEIVSASEVNMVEPLHADVTRSCISSFEMSSDLKTSSVMVREPVVTSDVSMKERLSMQMTQPTIEEATESWVETEEESVKQRLGSSVEKILESSDSGLAS